MSSIREKLTNMFSKVMAGTVTREEGTMLINHLAKEDQAETVKELLYLIDNPPPNVFPKTVLHTITLARNKAFYEIMVWGLEHKDEEVSILAAQELSRLKTSDAKAVLAEHLNSEAYHVRKASATALVQGFSEGSEMVKDHMLGHPEPFYRLTSALALASSGRKGLDTLLSILVSGVPGAMASAAEALAASCDELDNSDVSRVFDALMTAGDRKDTNSIVEILKVAASLKGKARGFEGYVLAFADYPFEPIRKEAKNALSSIRS